MYPEEQVQNATGIVITCIPVKKINQQYSDPSVGADQHITLQKKWNND